jgi:hypothetical protein
MCCSPILKTFGISLLNCANNKLSNIVNTPTFIVIPLTNYRLEFILSSNISYVKIHKNNKTIIKQLEAV